MKRSSALVPRVWIVAFAGIFAGGCNAILSNDVHELAPQSQRDAAPETSTPTDDASDSGSDTGANGPDGMAQDGAAQDTAVGNDAEDGSVIDSPGTECTPNATECRGQSIFQCSIAGHWVEIVKCPYVCANSVCSGLCVPGTMQCAGNTPQTCDANGQWLSSKACPNLCALGQCAGMCVPGTTQLCGNAATCNAGAMQTCDPTGTWGDCTPMPSTCVNVPATWQPVALIPTNAGDAGPVTCPDGFGTPQTLYTSASGADYACICNCNGTQSCSGTVTLNHFSALAADCSGVATPKTIAVSSTCATGGFGSIVKDDSYTISDVAYGAAPACAPSPAPTSQPPVVTQTAVVCTANAACPSGACLTPTQAMSMCVGQAGVQNCPSDYPTRTVMSSMISDTRGCGSCACGSTLSCTLTDVLLDNDGACSVGHPYVMTANDKCAAAPSTYPLNGVKAIGTSTGSGACAMTTPSQPTGTVALHPQSTMTVCCK